MTKIRKKAAKPKKAPPETPKKGFGEGFGERFAAPRGAKKSPPPHMVGFRPPTPLSAPPLLPEPKQAVLVMPEVLLLEDVVWLGRRRAQELLIQGVAPSLTDYRELRLVETAMSMPEGRVKDVLDKLADIAAEVLK